MGLNSVRDKFNIHYFDYFVPFKRNVDPTKLKSSYTLWLARIAVLVPKKNPNARDWTLQNISASTEDFSAIKPTKTLRYLKKLWLEVYK